jgi:hypothetical protein
MKDQRISEKTSHLAKDKGFDWSCNVYTNLNNYVLIDWECIYFTKELNIVSENDISRWLEMIELGEEIYSTKEDAMNDRENYGDKKNIVKFPLPTQSLLQKFLRDVHKIHIEITLGHDEDKIWYDANLYKIENGYSYNCLNENDISGISFGNVLEEGLFQALLLINVY